MSGFALAVALLGDGAALVELTGTIGPYDADEVHEGLADVGRQAYRRIVVDATACDVQDPDLISAIYDLARSVRGRDGSVALIAPARGDLAQIIRSTGLDAAIAVYDTRNGALDDLDLPDPV